MLDYRRGARHGVRDFQGRHPARGAGFGDVRGVFAVFRPDYRYQAGFGDFLQDR
jgi:hypothetical protein